MVGGPAGGSLRPRGSQPLLHPHVVEQVVAAARDRLDVVEVRPVAQQLANGDPLLARSREGRPERGDGLVVGQLPAVGEAMKDHRGEALGGGETERLGVLVPAAGARAVRPPRTEVGEDLISAAHDERAATRRAPHQLPEALGQRLEAGNDRAVGAGVLVCGDAHQGGHIGINRGGVENRGSLRGSDIGPIGGPPTKGI